MRLLHIADIHLDSPFAGRSSELRKRLREACRESLRRAVDLALDREVHVVLVAGDLLDGETMSLQTEGFLVDQLARLGQAGIPVVYATGNHDPGTPSGAVARTKWPENVTVVAGPEPRRVEIRDGEGRPVGFVTAAGHESSRVSDDLAAKFPTPRDELPEVAVLHTQVQNAVGSEEHDRYAPSDPAHLKSAGFDYWALGHVHTRQAVSDTPPIHYPGSTQGRSPRETGPRGGLVVELGPGGAQVDFHPLSPIRWERLTLADLDEVEGYHQLVSASTRALEAVAAEEPAEPGTEWMLVVELTGPSPLWSRLRSREARAELEDELAARLDAVAVELRTDRLGPLAALEDHDERQDVLGESLRLLGDVLRGAETVPGLEAELLAGYDPRRHESPEEYAAALLKDSHGELVARFLDRAEEG